MKQVNIPVIRNAHQIQFPETPLVLTISATRFGVSVENVVATMDVPSSHHGMLRPDRKNELLLAPARRLTRTPIESETARIAATMIQSSVSSLTMLQALPMTR
jgi:hypothetical protein